MKNIKVNKTNLLGKIDKYFIYIFILFFYYIFKHYNDFCNIDDEIYYLNGLILTYMLKFIFKLI